MFAQRSPWTTFQAQTFILCRHWQVAQITPTLRYLCCSAAVVLTGMAQMLNAFFKAIAPDCDVCGAASCAPLVFRRMVTGHGFSTMLVLTLHASYHKAVFALKILSGCTPICHCKTSSQSFLACLRRCFPCTLTDGDALPLSTCKQQLLCSQH